MTDQQDLIKQLVQALDLDELTQGYRRRLLILDSQIEGLNNQIRELTRLENDLRDILTKFTAVCKVCSQLNILIDAPSNGEPEKTGEDEWQKENSSHSRTLDVFAKNTS